MRIGRPTADGRGQVRRSNAGRQHHLVGRKDAIGGLDTDDAVIVADQGFDAGAGHELRAAPHGILDQHLRGNRRLDGALPGDMQGEVRQVGQVGLDAGGLGAIDAADAVAPGRVLGGEGLEALRRQVPAQPAAPGERDRVNRRLQPGPLGDGAHAQPEIGLRVAPARIDPGK